MLADVAVAPSSATPLVPSTYWGVVDCALDVAAARVYEDGESTEVRGVGRLFEFLIAAMTLCCVEALNSDELVLPWELVEPTVLAASSIRDSVSSEGGARVPSGARPFVKDFEPRLELVEAPSTAPEPSSGEGRDGV